MAVDARVAENSAELSRLGGRRERGDGEQRGVDLDCPTYLDLDCLDDAVRRAGDLVFHFHRFDNTDSLPLADTIAHGDSDPDDHAMHGAAQNNRSAGRSKATSARLP